jgi:hypothetical protein
MRFDLFLLGWFALLIKTSRAVLAYIKKVPDSTQTPSTSPGDEYFKIAEDGLISSSKFLGFSKS